MNQTQIKPKWFVFFFRNFEIYDAETPKKSSYTRVHKNIKSFEEQSLDSKSSLGSSFYFNCSDVDSLKSFPALLSCSSNKLEKFESRIKNSDNSSNKVNLEKTSRRVKLFSDLENGDKKSESDDHDLKLFDNFYIDCKNNFASSTPKTLKSHSSSVASNLGTGELTKSSVAESLSERMSTNSFNSITEISSSKSMSISDHDSSFKNKDNKTNSKITLGDFMVNDLSIGDNKRDKKGKYKKRIQTIKLNSVSNRSTIHDKFENSIDNLPRSSIFKTDSNNLNDVQVEELSQMVSLNLKINLF